VSSVLGCCFAYDPCGLSFEPPDAPDAGSKRSGRSKEIFGLPAAAEHGVNARLPAAAEDWGQRDVGGGGRGGV
jgi:hypothetical protein